MRFSLLILLCAPVWAGAQSRWQGCLPSGIKADEVSVVEGAPGSLGQRRITVGQRLKQLKARCRARTLVDGKGRQVRFYRLTGCWGNPPEDYQEILARQQRELADLKKRFTVLEITCNPTGELLP